MKRFLTVTFLIVLLLGTATYIVYQFYLPDLLARAMLSQEVPAYLPRRILNHLEPYRKAINKGTDDVVQTMHREDISLEDVLEVLDNTTEEQVYAFVDTLNETKATKPDEVFDLAKEAFPVDFNVELFRQVFKEHVDRKLIARGITYANLNRKTRDIDFETARAVARRILIEKEKEFRSTKQKIDK